MALACMFRGPQAAARRWTQLMEQLRQGGQKLQNAQTIKQDIPRWMNFSWSAAACILSVIVCMKWDRAGMRNSGTWPKTVSLDCNSSRMKGRIPCTWGEGSDSGWKCFACVYVCVLMAAKSNKDKRQTTDVFWKTCLCRNMVDLLRSEMVESILFFLKVDWWYWADEMPAPQGEFLKLKIQRKRNCLFMLILVSNYIDKQHDLCLKRDALYHVSY